MLLEYADTYSSPNNLCWALFLERSFPIYCLFLIFQSPISSSRKPFTLPAHTSNHYQPPPPPKNQKLIIYLLYKLCLMHVSDCMFFVFSCTDHTLLFWCVHLCVLHPKLWTTWVTNQCLKDLWLQQLSQKPAARGGYFVNEWEIRWFLAIKWVTARGH